MKRILILLVICLVAVALVACVQGETGQEVTDGIKNITDLPGYTSPPTDMRMYRGVVKDIVKDGDTVTLTLEQWQGTDFGKEKIEAVVDGTTNTVANVDEIKAGDYIEVFYGGELDNTIAAIVLNVLPNAEDSVYTGTVKEIETKDGAGSILLSSQDRGEILFRYDGNTGVYLNADSVEQGDTINVFFSGVTTKSNPPQAFALELRQIQQ